MGKLGLVTLLHPIVDACSAAVFIIVGPGLEQALVYNWLAFGLQLPLGLVLDRKCDWRSVCFALGMAFLPLGAVLSAAEALVWPALVLVCLGNAMFHVTAGMDVLDDFDGRPCASALFISTGALGLFVGKAFSRGCPFAFWSILVISLILLSALALRHGLGTSRQSRLSVTTCCGLNASRATASFLLIALVSWRSWAGLVSASRTSGTALSIALAGAAVIWLGKVSGGWMAERLGNAPVVGMSVLCGLVLWLMASPEFVWVWAGLLFVSQMATGPVLTWLYRASNRQSGLAFGLNCLALLIGFLAFIHR